MVIAMRAMGEVQMAGDQIIDMVSVRHGLMSAVRAMAMSGLMPLAAMARRASSRVFRSDTEPMFIDVVAVWMMKVSVMEIIGVVVMGDSWMPAVRSVLMTVMLMDGMVAHRRTPFVTGVGADSITEV
jgi:hypothetical protein